MDDNKDTMRIRRVKAVLLLAGIGLVAGGAAAVYWPLALIIPGLAALLLSIRK